MLGGLQFVAKVLELWFGSVAVNLIYNVTMWLASRDEGLPIELLSASVEFADPRSLRDTFPLSVTELSEAETPESTKIEVTTRTFHCSYNLPVPIG